MDDLRDTEEFFRNQKTTRNNQLHLRTGSSYKQNCYIRDHINKIILHQFNWSYWVTFTFGYKPNLDEVEDILYKLHYRVDRRLVKHIRNKQVRK